MTKPTPPPLATPRPAVPPPPGRDTLPPAPPYGWVGDPDQLTGNELDEISRMVGAEIMSQRMRLVMCAAVALARRSDPDLYPWSVVDALTLSDLTMPDRQAAPDPT